MYLVHLTNLMCFNLSAIKNPRKEHTSLEKEWESSTILNRVSCNMVPKLTYKYDYYITIDIEFCH
jgi:hypothetical protein